MQGTVKITVLRNKVDGYLRATSHLECKCKRAPKNRPVKSQEFEIPGRTPLLISNTSRDTEENSKGREEIYDCASAVKRLNGLA